MNLKALRKVSYGMYIVTSHLDGKPNGQIANTVFQVTSEPATIAVSINKQNLTHEFIEKSGVFAVSVISKDAPLTLIGNFGFKSGREMDKFSSVNYKIGVTGSPVVLDSAVAFLEAEVINSLDVGTHTIFIGKIVNADVLSDDEPMTYAFYHLVKRGTSPKNAPTYIKAEPKEKEEKAVKKYRCKICGYIYDPEKGDPDGGIKPGTPFEEIPDDWVCPVCGASKDEFEEV